MPYSEFANVIAELERANKKPMDALTSDERDHAVQMFNDCIRNAKRDAPPRHVTYNEAARNLQCAVAVAFALRQIDFVEMLGLFGQIMMAQILYTEHQNKLHPARH